MDEVQRRRFADGYRQMPDEKLAILLAESNSLTDEARQALVDAIDERPDPAAIRTMAEDKAISHLAGSSGRATQDQSGGNGSPQPERKRSIFSTEPIVDAVTARKAAKHGAIAGLFFAGMYLVGGALTFFGRSPMDGKAIEDEVTIYSMLVVDVLVIALILLLCWRINTGRGWISSVVLLVWFLVEIAFKLVGGSTNFGWIIFYIAVTVGFIDGARGTWACRKYAKQASLPSAIPTAP